jgi:HK97 family phage major capsid protein
MSKIERFIQEEAQFKAALLEAINAPHPDDAEVNRLHAAYKSTVDRLEIARSLINTNKEPEVKAWERGNYGPLPFEGATRSEKAFNAYKMGCFVLGMSGNDTAARWCQEHMGVDVKSIKAMTETTPGAGGFAVPAIVQDTLIYLREKASVMRNYSRVWPMKSNILNVPILSGSVTANWYSDAAAITPSDGTLTNAQLTAKKLAALTVISSELDEDAVVAIGSYVAADMANKLGHEEDRVCFNGKGVAGDGGITGVMQYIYALSGSKANISSLVLAPAGSVTTPASMTLATWQAGQGKLPVYAQDTAAWYMHKTLFFTYVADKLLSAGGQNYNSLAVGAGRDPEFLGYPVRFVQDMPQTLTINEPFAIFGALDKGTAFGDKRGLNVQTSYERYFDQDAVAIRATERFGFSGAIDPGTVASPGSQAPGSVIVFAAQGS